MGEFGNEVFDYMHAAYDRIELFVVFRFVCGRRVRVVARDDSDMPILMRGRITHDARYSIPSCLDVACVGNADSNDFAALFMCHVHILPKRVVARQCAKSGFIMRIIRRKYRRILL